MMTTLFKRQQQQQKINNKGKKKTPQSKHFVKREQCTHARE
jgi:hypothetical protein